MVWRTMLIGLLLLMSVGFTGAQNNDQPKFAVQVLVNGDLESEAESYLKRELRSLGDVEITDMFGGYGLSVVIIEHKYKSSGTKTGQISCAYLGLKRFPFPNLISKLPREHFDTVFDATRNLYYFPNLFFLNTNRERAELKQLCQEIVTEFDTDLLEPDR